MKALAAILFVMISLWNVAFADDALTEVVEKTANHQRVQHISGKTRVPLIPERTVRSGRTSPTRCWLSA